MLVVAFLVCLFLLALAVIVLLAPSPYKKLYLRTWIIIAVISVVGIALLFAAAFHWELVSR